MEHSVPQNVTSFEFHLVGDMTLKQFIYLAAGVGVAYLTFVALLPINSFVAAPIIAASALTGIAFAFFPIADRSLDHWVVAFFKAVYVPTQGFWRSPASAEKTFARVAPDDPFFFNRLQTYLLSVGSPSMVTASPAKLKPQLLRLTPAAPINQPPVRPPTSQMAPAPKTVLPHQAPLVSAPPPPDHSPKLKSGAASTGLGPEVSKYIHSLQAKISESEEKIQELQTALSQPPPVYFTPSPPIVKTVVATKPVFKTQLLLTSFPNVINGVITDAGGSYLEGVIVTIHDKNGLPVRALKTNKLGQFAGVTPLPSGVYTITFEKEGLEFDTLQATLIDKVLPPFAVSAKKGGVM